MSEDETAAVDALDLVTELEIMALVKGVEEPRLELRFAGFGARDTVKGKLLLEFRRALIAFVVEDIGAAEIVDSALNSTQYWP